MVLTKEQAGFVSVFMDGSLVGITLPRGYCYKSIMMVVFDSIFSFWILAFIIRIPYHKLLAYDNFIFLLGCLDFLRYDMLGPLWRTEVLMVLSQMFEATFLTEMWCASLSATFRKSESKPLSDPWGQFRESYYPLCWFLSAGVFSVS